MVGFETSDDAAVYRLSKDIAMINTIDFITPPVDDPYWFGQIAAANAISDIYSMGGRPLTALNVVMFPSGKLDIGILKDILRGGNDKVIEAGASLVGGHSVDDEEPKYGLCVNGIVHPDKIITNSGARPGDSLILTKMIGSGVLFNAVRSGKIPFKTIEQNLLPILAELNGPAIQASLNFDLHACTDITGFGIAGHALEMASGSKTQIIIQHAKLPFYPGALNMYRKGETTGSNKANRSMTKKHLDIRATLSSAEEEIIFDPQTSGGLLLSVPSSQVQDMLNTLHDSGVKHAVHIGEVIDGPPGLIIV